MKRLSHFIAEKNIFHIIRIVQEHFWHNYSFQRVLYPTKLKNYENFREWGLWQAPSGMEIREGGGGSKAKMPSVGWYGYFSELHIKCKAIDMVSHDTMLMPDLTIKVEQDTKCKKQVSEVRSSSCTLLSRNSLVKLSSKPQNQIYKPASNNRRIWIAAIFHFVVTVEKTNRKLDNCYIFKKQLKTLF